MINAARSIGGSNLEDLDEFSRDYLLKWYFYIINGDY